MVAEVTKDDDLTTAHYWRRAKDQVYTTMCCGSFAPGAIPHPWEQDPKNCAACRELVAERKKQRRWWRRLWNFLRARLV